MKNKFKITLASLILVLFAGTFTSCLKSRSDRTNFDNLTSFVQIPEGGLANIGNAALNLDGNPSDTFQFHINYAGKNPTGKDLTVTFDNDPAVIAAYNADPNNKTKYDAFPSNIYSLPVKTATIKAGQNYSEVISFVVFPANVDPTKNYMFALTIKDAQGVPVSGNFGTIYYHLVGNPIAGSYNWDFTRYNKPTKGVSLSGLSFTGHTTTFKPDDPNTIEVNSGYFTQPRYVITFDNNGGVLSNFQVAFNADDYAGLIGAGIVIATAPHFTILDPVNGIYQIEYQTASRYIIDKFYK